MPPKGRPPRRESRPVSDARYLISSRVVRGTLDIAARRTIFEHESPPPQPKARLPSLRIGTLASNAALDRWVEDTLLFQRIAGTPESSREDLEAQWRAMRPPARLRAAESIRTRLAAEAGRNRS